MKIMARYFFLILLNVLSINFAQAHIKASSEEFLSMVSTLASPQMEGRGVGTNGLFKAENFVANKFSELGLSPIENINTKNPDIAGINNPFFMGILIHPQNGIEITQDIIMHNIVGEIGAGCLLGVKPVLLGAHMDHLGYGGIYSLDQGLHAIHPGADDNASGVSAILLAAKLIASRLNNDMYLNLTSCYIIAAFTGEEIGIRGSTALIKQLIALNHKPKAMLNFDMVGRLFNKPVGILAAGTAVEWEKIINESCTTTNVPCRIQKNASGGSDHIPFLLESIPSLFFFTGVHADYHRVSDTFEKIDPVGGYNIATIGYNVAINAMETDLTFVNPGTIMDTPDGPAPTGPRPFLGTVPDMSGDPTPVPGVLLVGTVPGSPSEKAGVLAGDVLLAIDGVQTPTLEIFAKVLSKLVPDQRVILKIWRNNAELNIVVVVGKRG